MNLPDFWLRVTRAGDTITAAYSLDDPAAAGQWIDLQATPNASEIFSPADGPVYVGALGVNGSVAPTYEYIRFTPDADCPDSCSPLSDQFGGSELDPKWELVNPHATSRRRSRRRSSDAAARAGRPVRRQRQRADAAPAGAGGLMGGDGEGRARAMSTPTARRPGWR